MQRLILILTAFAGLTMATAQGQVVAKMSDTELLAKMKLAGERPQNLGTIRALMGSDGFFDPRDNSFNSGNSPHDLTARNDLYARSKRDQEANARGRWVSFGPRNMTIVDENGEYHRVAVNDFQAKVHYVPALKGGTRLVEDGPTRVQLMNGRWLYYDRP